MGIPFNVVLIMFMIVCAIFLTWLICLWEDT